MSLAGAVVMALLGVALLGVGYLVRYRGATHLIAGFDPEAVDDEEGLARFVGLNVLYVGILTVDVAVVEYNFRSKEVFWLAYAALVGLLAVRMVHGARRY